jgi:Fe-S cluster biogenesis protein NfuA
VFIQTEDTPNPATMKFLPGREVVPMGNYDFASADEAAASPLATRLFQVDGIQGVFLGADFISITKAAEAEWFLLKPVILGVIMEHFATGRPVIAEGAKADSGAEADIQYDERDAEIVEQIKELLDTRVRPAVARDGGDIVFHSFDKGIVVLHMRGACAGCPSSTMTLKMGIENMLRHYIPEVVEVRAAGL